MFHLAFGGALLVTLLPIIFITSFVVQQTRNTWPDIIIHTLINGSGFLLVAFGMVG
jgi:membrane protease YdiL (CAAX protease family)